MEEVEARFENEGKRKIALWSLDPILEGRSAGEGTTFNCVREAAAGMVGGGPLGGACRRGSCFDHRLFVPELRFVLVLDPLVTSEP